jgi:hypothetical protein
VSDPSKTPTLRSRKEAEPSRRSTRQRIRKGEIITLIKRLYETWKILTEFIFNQKAFHKLQELSFSINCRLQLIK